MNYKRLLASVLLFSIIMSLCACSFIFGVKCPNCGEKCDSDMLYCPYCRAELTGSKKCSKGHENVDGAKYCAECGEPLGGSSNNSPSNSDSDNNVNDSNNSVDNDSQGDNSQAEMEQKTWLLLEERYEENGRTFKYFYDANGYLVGYEVWDDTTGLFNYETFTNDERGNCVERYSDFIAGLGFDATTTYVNTYDTQGRLTKSCDENGNYNQYYYEGDELVKVSHVNYGTEYYDLYENGRMILSYRKDGTTSYEETTIEFYYDSNGKCTGTNNESFEVDEYGNIVADAGGCTYKYITKEDYFSQYLHNNKYANGQNNGSNGSSNGSSGGTTTKGYPCEWCKQTGQLECSVCDGTGKIFSRFDSNGNKVMKTCTYYKCRYGSIECYHCGGDGIYLND